MTHNETTLFPYLDKFIEIKYSLRKGYTNSVSGIIKELQPSGILFLVNGEVERFISYPDIKDAKLFRLQPGEKELKRS